MNEIMVQPSTHLKWQAEDARPDGIFIMFTMEVFRFLELPSLFYMP